MNVRSLTGFERPYYEINREERNLAAIFFHVLLLADNLERFLRRTGSTRPLHPEQAGAYFEYAYLRDLWEHRLKSNDDKRALITTMLGTDDVRGLESASVAEWNAHFGASPRASSEHIQSPAKWSLSRFDANIASNDDFLRTCRFKWSFNIKPDLVLHTDNDHAVCVEAKLASDEGRYPASEREKPVFKRRGLPYVGQTDLQHEMLTRLLGVETTFVFLVQDPRATSKTHTTLSWHDAFAAMDLSTCPAFVRRWIDRLRPIT